MSGALPTPQEFASGLPIGDQWVWYAHAVAGGSYDDGTIQLGEFGTLREFFQYVHHVPAPWDVFMGDRQLLVEKRPIGAYSIFRKGIRPAWEDVHNQRGGELCARAQLAKEDMERLWPELCLSIVNGDVPEVTGFRIVHKKDRRNCVSHKVEVWLTSCDDDMVHKIRKLLSNLPVELSYDWFVHGESRVRASRK